MAGSPFRNLDLAGLALDRLNLQVQDWNFEGTRFSHASLVRATFSGNFNRCDFEGTDLSGSFLGFARFHSANFESARLAGARLIQTKLRGANLQNADLSDAEITGTDYCGADLTGALLERAQAGICQGKGTRYDRRTRLPDGFVPGDGWVRVDEP